MKNKLDTMKYKYIRHDVYNWVRRFNRETREYERYDFNHDKWVVDNDYNSFEDFFDYSNVTEEEALTIISDKISSRRLNM